MPAAEPRLPTLDMLRGVAALGVVALHAPHPPGTAAWLPRGYLAVDLFFVLSGFVLSRRHGAELRLGEQRGAFIRDRLWRLMPLYLLATGAGAILMIGPDASGVSWAPRQFAVMLISGALLVPSPATDATGHLFPALFPAWSLMWEWVASLVFAVTAPWLGRRQLIVILPLAALGVVAAAAACGSLDIGVGRATGLWGGTRIVWGFLAGVALERMARTDRMPRLPDWSIAAALIAMLAWPGGWGFDAVAAIGFCPLLVALGAVAIPSRAARAGSWLGAQSYAVYLFHPAVYALVARLSGRFLGIEPAEWPPGVALVLAMAATLVIAETVTRRMDAPLRAARRQLSPPRPRPGGKAGALLDG